MRRLPLFLLLLVTLAQSGPLPKEARSSISVRTSREDLVPHAARQSFRYTSRGRAYQRADRGGDDSSTDNRPQVSPLNQGPQRNKDFEETKTLIQGQECEACEETVSEKETGFPERFDKGGGEGEGKGIQDEDRPEVATPLDPSGTARVALSLDFTPEENLHQDDEGRSSALQKSRESLIDRQKGVYGMKIRYSDDSTVQSDEGPYSTEHESLPVEKEEDLSKPTRRPGSFVDIKTEVTSDPSSEDKSELDLKHDIAYSSPSSGNAKVKYDTRPELSQSPEDVTQGNADTNPDHEEKIEPSLAPEDKASPTEPGPEQDTDNSSSFKLLPTETTFPEIDPNLEEGIHTTPTLPEDIAHPEEVTQSDPQSEIIEKDTNPEFSEQHQENSGYETVPGFHREDLGHALSWQNLEFKIYPEQVKDSEPVPDSQQGDETPGHENPDPIYTDRSQGRILEHQARLNTNQDHQSREQQTHEELKTPVGKEPQGYKERLEYMQRNNTDEENAPDRPPEIENPQESSAAPSPPTESPEANSKYSGASFNISDHYDEAIEHAETDPRQTTMKDDSRPSPSGEDGASEGGAKDGQEPDENLESSGSPGSPEDKALVIVYAEAVEDKKSPEDYPVEYVYGEEYLYYYDNVDIGEEEYPEFVDYSQPGAKTRPLSRESKLLYFDTVVGSVLQLAPRGSQLIRARGDQLPPLVNRLVENATLIRPNLNDSFSCEERGYGYYADQYNECQVFHVCVPLHQLFPGAFTTQDLYHFSFICPEHTIFTQDAMVCSWQDSALPCSEAHHLYHLNNHFFVVAEDIEKEPTTSTLTSSGVPVLAE
ncbi:uncharacterized protein LOC143037554 [Oratosquilla oratoria]|uniref:uncharacterized protein LOC143037554 n=1 Tax=Oratosquilla oratoria TaxID=337810 RepID=UPI003F776209